MYLGRIYITLKESVLDPQGQTVLQALHDLGHPEISDIRIGKYIELKLDAIDSKDAGIKIESYCKKLLANPVIEQFRYDVTDIK